MSGSSSITDAEVYVLCECVNDVDKETKWVCSRGCAVVRLPAVVGE